jgi:hypothetical protein
MCSILEIAPDFRFTLLRDEDLHLASALRDAQPQQLRSQPAVENVAVGKRAVLEL